MPYKDPEKQREWYALNKDKVAANHRKWRAANKLKYNAYQLSRVKRKSMTTPKEPNRRKLMALFYEMAKLETERTGRRVEVDHIVPLRNRLVSGLHNEFNLQLLFSEDNRAKRNVVWPEMPS